MRFILASASSARQKLLIQAGIHPECISSKVVEEDIRAPDTTELVNTLATAKAEDVDQYFTEDADRVVLGCDSLLDFAGESMGKPGSVEAVITRWEQISGKTGILRTGHCLILHRGSENISVTHQVSTEVSFQKLNRATIEAYAHTGEPEHVAGGFTIDGIGSALISGIVGDPSNVIGLSVPWLYDTFTQLRLPWPAFEPTFWER